MQASENPKLSLQLHSVRDMVSQDFEKTLKEVATMGFDGVEFAGRYGPYKDDPQGLKSFLQNLGLEVSGAHIPLSQLQGEQGDKNLQFVATLGAQIIIIPFDSRANNPNQLEEFVTELKEIALRVNEHGLKLGYHNHASEFEVFKENTFWDYIAQNTPADFVLQLDVGWAIFAKVDPIEYIKRYPNRTQSTHYKIRSYKGRPGPVSPNTKVIIGQDDYDWQALISANINYGNTQWIVIEQEEYPEHLSQLQTVKASLNGLEDILFDMRN